MVFDTEVVSGVDNDVTGGILVVAGTADEEVVDDKVVVTDVEIV